ncbi:MAG: hypothetical protein PHQ35_08310 [Phycisphaerae bacterium]|nr:hypothetical protein [Phycisphaerae bacterium]MDD5381492.1 hypothetical protein [Phycisphaerae bacterium]
MRAKKAKQALHSEHGGYILILMVLIVCIIGVFIWLDPMALMPGSGSGMPWNEERRLVPSSEKVKQPNEGQPEILDNLGFEGAIVENGDVKGGVDMFILTDGRIKGVWEGKYNPEPDITWEVMGSRFKGNIDPTKIYSDKDGEDPKKLYFIAKGESLILVTNSKTDKIKTATGAIYVTGWLDNEYNAAGKITITSDKKTYWEYFWQSKGEKVPVVPDFGPALPRLF